MEEMMGESFKKYEQRINNYFTYELDSDDGMEDDYDDHHINTTDRKFIPKLHIPPKSSNRSNNSKPLNINLANNHIGQYFQNTEQYLEKSFHDPIHIKIANKIPSNFTYHDKIFLKQLMNRDDIVIKPADKNLGLAIVDTSWYDKELRKMLSDNITYQVMNMDEKDLRTLTKNIYNRIQTLIKKFKDVLEREPKAAGKQMKKYLKSKVSPKDAKLPLIYLLIKIHKKTLCGRPIVPSKNWITSPASVVLDMLLQPITSQVMIPWLVRDSTSLINCIEHHPIPEHHRNCHLVTADIASLYTNIDTKLGLQLMRQYLIEIAMKQTSIALDAQFYADKIDFIMDLLSLVMNESYLQYHDTMYKQIDGTAMGTSVAPVYANIFVYMLERQLVQQYMSDGILYFYRRFLDDVFLLVNPSSTLMVQTGFNSLNAKLQFDFITSDKQAAFLDLQLYKGSRFMESGILDMKVHQKSLNLYLYIPYKSFHTPAMKKSFITMELVRYIRNSSDLESYMDVKTKFYARLRDRGYPSRLLNGLFESVSYTDRRLFLLRSAERSNQLADTRVRSGILQEQSLRAKYIAGLHQKQSTLPFVIHYSRLSRTINVRQHLLIGWERIRNAHLYAFKIPKPIIAYKNFPSLEKQLVHRKIQQHKLKLRKIIVKSVNMDFFKPITKTK